MAGMYVMKAGQIATVDGLSGVALTSRAFESAFVVSICLSDRCGPVRLLTMISWSYYGLKAGRFCLVKRRQFRLGSSSSFAFVVIGATTKLGPVIDFSGTDFRHGLVNIIGLYLLMPRSSKSEELSQTSFRWRIQAF